MDKTENNTVFIKNPNKRDRILVFQDKLKRHLSKEYLYIVDKKDDLENQLMQLKTEQNRENKTLFPNIENKGARKYFSPLNIKEIEEVQQDEKNRQLKASIERTESAISDYNVRLSEIKDFLRDIDILLDLEENHGEENSSIPQNMEYFEEDAADYSYNNEIYPQMLRNLYEFSDVIQKDFNQVEVLIEFNDNNIETPVELNRNLISQIYYNVCKVMEDYDISTILIQGEISGHTMKISINYICDQEEIEVMSVNYEIEKNGL